LSGPTEVVGFNFYKAPQTTSGLNVTFSRLNCLGRYGGAAQKLRHHR